MELLWRIENNRAIENCRHMSGGHVWNKRDAHDYWMRLYQIYSSETMFWFVSLQNNLGIAQYAEWPSRQWHETSQVSKFIIHYKKAVTLEFKMYYHFDNKAIIGSESKKDCYVISHFKLNAKSGRGRCRKTHSGCICVIRCSIGT